MDHVEHYTADWFSHNINNWTRWLAQYKGKHGVRGLEIGSWEGRSAVWLLKNILTGEGSTLECCDYGYKADTFRANTAPWADRVTLRCGASYLMLTELRSGGEFDFIYVDGDHTPFGVLRDATLAWPLLKVGGLMIFDDYLFVHHTVDPNYGKPQWSSEAALKAIADHPDMTTKTGIDGFLAVMVGQHEVVEQTYQLAVRKTKPIVPWADA